MLIRTGRVDVTRDSLDDNNEVWRLHLDPKGGKATNTFTKSFRFTSRFRRGTANDIRFFYSESGFDGDVQVTIDRRTLAGFRLVAERRRNIGKGNSSGFKFRYIAVVDATRQVPPDWNDNPNP